MTAVVFVANRGEIALRILTACRGLGLRTVLGVSAADRDSMPAALADRTVVLGGARADRSYLAQDTVLAAALGTGCTAIHPGYGFLSENAAFAEACAANGLTFIGPSPQALRRLGDKIEARELAESLGVPVSPGGTAVSPEEVHRLAESIGYPLLIKAAHGGGGKGMKLVTGPEELTSAWQVASGEALAAFGHGAVFMERFVERARHVEVQILGDRHGGRLHVGERDCTVQYRYQKVIEESASEGLTPEDRRVLTESALRIAAELDYVGLGTVEFLFDESTGAISFLEVNPRLQVEHPVTEAATGIDLVREQIQACLGEPLSFKQSDVVFRGHAVECRITAQDPARGLAPSPGTLRRWRPPRRGGLRLDSHMYEGYRFPPFYDALMGKLVAWGEDRARAIDLMSDALAEFEIEGFPTSLGLLRRIVADPDFRANRIHTNWLTERLENEAHS
ncbi:acetyl-CoA carboxylase biotin carboxylase subunit [Nonomuraea harbinensis]|uniref:Acetyl/propionyl/methylcrotonyl-CoA carboxylase subunit alpha n=1 Tax=Nonomuraea harbinensis TaxID=1286938 RepID=A0ABW1C8Q5_9ACTN|nr:biotin carboxylase N-terminal domain-containing protein [Nonomuraea harbinensis]